MKKATNLNSGLFEMKQYEITHQNRILGGGKNVETTYADLKGDEFTTDYIKDGNSSIASGDITAHDGKDTNVMVVPVSDDPISASPGDASSMGISL